MTRNKQTTYRKKGLSVFLTVLMVLSVIAMSAAFAGSVAASTDHELEWNNVDIDVDFWQGETVNITDLDDNGDIIVDNPSFVRIVEGTPGNPGDPVAENRIDNDTLSVVFDSSDTESLEGFYHFVLENESAETTTTSTTEWQVQNIALSFDDDEGELDEDGYYNTTLTFDEDNRNVAQNVTVSGTHDGDALDNETLAEIFEDVDDIGAEEYVRWDGVTETNDTAANFTETGDYEFTISVTNTTAEATVSLTVDPHDPEDEFTLVGFTESSYAEERGDILEFEIEVENPEKFENGTDAFTVLIEEDDYDANLTLDNLTLDEDENVLTVYWNTYEAGKSAAGANLTADDEVFWSNNANVTIEDETTIEGDFRLNTGLYFATLFDDLDQPRVDTANLHVNDRHTGDAEVSIAPMGVVDANHSIDDIMANTSAFSDVAVNDSLIIEWEVSGVFGYLLNDSSETNPFDKEFGDEVSVEFTNTESPTYQNPSTFDETDDGVAIVLDEENNRVFLIIEDTADTEELDYDQEWEVTFTVDSDIADDETETGFEVLERIIDFVHVEDEIQVVPGEDSEIRGTTTIAPGSEITGDWDFRPVDRDDFSPVEVVQDGEYRTFTFVEDFSAFEDHMGETFEIEAEEPSGETIDATAIWADTPEYETQTGLDAFLDQFGWDDLDEATEAIEELQATIQEIEDDLEAALDDLDAAMSEIDSLEGELEDAEELVDHYQTLYEGAQETIGDLNDEIGELDDEIVELNNEIDELNDDINSLNDQISDLQSDLDSWTDVAGDYGIDSPGDLEDALDELQDLQDADDDADDDDEQPAFGPLAALIALLAGGALLARRKL